MTGSAEKKTMRILDMTQGMSDHSSSAGRYEERGEQHDVRIYGPNPLRRRRDPACG